jgi:hypothetical protein
MTEFKLDNIIFRVSSDEKKKLKELAEKHGLSMSEYIRAIVFQNSELDKAVAKEARQQVDIFLHVLNQNGMVRNLQDVPNNSKTVKK